MKLLLFLLAFPAFGSEPPKVFVDKGACPFECCTYRQWNVTAETPLFDKVSGTTEIAKAKRGETVQGLTGEVHTVPSKVKIKIDPHGEPSTTEVKDGDTVYVLTYSGEGFWKVWKDGRVVDGVFQSWDKKENPKSTWWVQIKLKNGKTGWTKETAHFGNMDACG
jgi:hypothetical protein